MIYSRHMTAAIAFDSPFSGGAHVIVRLGSSRCGHSNVLGCDTASDWPPAVPVITSIQRHVLTHVNVRAVDTRSRINHRAAAPR